MAKQVIVSGVADKRYNSKVVFKSEDGGQSFALRFIVFYDAVVEDVEIVVSREGMRKVFDLLSEVYGNE